jgi:hypothetical protein
MTAREEKAASPCQGEADQHNTFNSNFNPIDHLLSKLESVKRTGPNTWIFSVPTRKDKHPSGTIRELPDGRILMHDFGGDATAEILAAIGLTFSDLFPKPLGEFKRERKPFSAMDALTALDFEATVVYLHASDMAKGLALSTEERERLLLAASRIAAAREVVRG